MNFAILTQSKQDGAKIAQCFAADGVACQYFDCSQALLVALTALSYALLLIDTASFEAMGGELLGWCASYPGRAPKLIVYGRFADRDSMFRAFAAGASDVLVGGLDQNEMYLRVRRALRVLPERGAEPERLALGPYQLDRTQRALRRDGRGIELSEREFTMAWLFFSTPGTFFSKRKLAALLAPAEQECSARTVEQHVYQLRRKLGIGRDGVVRLRTIYSLGYKLEVSASATGL